MSSSRSFIGVFSDENQIDSIFPNNKEDKLHKAKDERIDFESVKDKEEYR